MATVYAGLRRTADNDGCLCRLHRPDDDLRAMVGFHPSVLSLHIPRLLGHHAAPATQPGPTSIAANEGHLTRQRDYVAPACGALISGTTSHAEVVVSGEATARQTRPASPAQAEPNDAAASSVHARGCPNGASPGARFIRGAIPRREIRRPRLRTAGMARTARRLERCRHAGGRPSTRRPRGGRPGSREGCTSAALR